MNSPSLRDFEERIVGRMAEAFLDLCGQVGLRCDGLREIVRECVAGVAEEEERRGRNVGGPAPGHGVDVVQVEPHASAPALLAQWAEGEFPTREAFAQQSRAVRSPFGGVQALLVGVHGSFRWLSYAGECTPGFRVDCGGAASSARARTAERAFAVARIFSQRGLT